MNSKVVELGGDIIKTVLAEINLENRDLSNTLIIFPGKRPSYFLLNEIKKELKGAFIPPTILSMDEFIDFSYEKELKIAHKRLDNLSACAILYDLLNQGRDGFILSNLKDLNYFLPFGLNLLRVFEELCIEKVSLSKIKEIDCLVGEGSKLMGDLFRLSEVYGKFYEALEAKKLSTRGLRYKKVSEGNLFLKDFDKIIFAGFYALTMSERDIFRKFFEEERALFIFQGEEAEKSFNRELVEENWVDIDKVKIYEANDTHQEVFKTVDLIVRDIKEKGGESFLIVVLSAETLMPLITALDLEDKDYNVSLGYPLIRTPLYTFLQHLFNVIISMDGDNIYASDYLNFILHPYTKNIMYKGSSEITRIIFHTIEETLNRKRFSKFLNISELEEDEFLADVYERLKDKLGKDEIRVHLKNIHNETIRKFTKLENIRDFIRKTKDLIEFIYRTSTAKRHILFYPFCEAMLDTLTEVQCSEISEKGFNNLYDYFDFFKKIISYSHVPFKGTPIKDIQVLGFLETRNLKFDNIYILDVNEGIIPDTKREDNILPYDVRIALGLSTYRDRERLYSYYLRNLIASSKNTTIFYVKDDNKERSRFVERILWEKEKKEGSLNKKFVTPLSYNITLKPYEPKGVFKDERIINYLKGLTFSATSLDTYYDCPLKFYYKYILLPKQEESVYDELESKDIGDIIHRILFIYYSERGMAIDIDRLRLIINEVFKEQYGEKIKGQVFLLKYQVEKRLAQLIEFYKRILEKEYIEIRTLQLEKRYDLKVKIEEVGEINMVGKIDKIEKRDDEIFIIDYKTKYDASEYKIKWDDLNIDDRETWDRAIKKIQIPFYIFLYVNKENIPPQRVNSSYILLRAKELKNIEFRLFGDKEDREQIFREKITSLILKLLEEIFLKENFEPTKDRAKKCPNCEFKFICRV